MLLEKLTKIISKSGSAFRVAIRVIVLPDKREPEDSIIASLSLRREGDTTLWIEHAPVGVLNSTAGEVITVAPPSSIAELDGTTLADMLGIDLGANPHD